jgi:hypothetical protein
LFSIDAQIKKSQIFENHNATRGSSRRRPDFTPALTPPVFFKVFDARSQ